MRCDGLVALLVACAVFPEPGYAQPAGPPSALTLDAAIERAVGADPELRAAAAEAEAARLGRDAAGAWFSENPSVDAAAGPRRSEGETTLDLSVSIVQPVEVGGQRGARREAADARLAAADARLAARRALLASEVREAFGRALGAVERVALEDAAVALADEAVAAVEERVRAGDAARLEQNAAVVERARARREAREARREHDAELGALRLLLGVPPDEALTLHGRLTEVAAQSGAPVSGAADPISLLAAQTPEVAAAREELRVARADRDLARRSVVPPLRLGAGYAREERADIAQALVSIDLPLFQRNRAERADAGARVTRAESALAAVDRRSAEAIRAARTARDAARALVAESGGAALAAAEENADLAREAYAAGKIGFLELLIVRRDALDARRAHVDALVELNAAEARLQGALPAAPR